MFEGRLEDSLDMYLEAGAFDARRQVPCLRPTARNTSFSHYFKADNVIREPLRVMDPCHSNAFIHSVFSFAWNQC